MKKGREGAPVPTDDLERRLWDAANELWTNSSLKPSEYAPPILGLIFLKYADAMFTRAQREIAGKATVGGPSVRPTTTRATSSTFRSPPVTRRC